MNEGRNVAAAKRVLNKLLTAGHQAYLVGGYVRDVLLNKQVDDIDIATSALPDEVLALFTHAIPTGLQHGTVTVLEAGYAFEVTTFRTESGYADYRRPEHVQFVTDIVADLQRRDFTMNAMAMDIDGKLIDPFHGQQALQQGVLRCVGEPRERFEEDALRMMRCIRFAANYELLIEADTWQALLEKRALLRHVAMERIRVELEKTIAGPAPQKGLKLLAESKLVEQFKVDVGLRSEALANLAQAGFGDVLVSSDDTASRVALLYMALHCSAEQAQQSLHRLTCSTKQKRAVVSILQCDEWVRELGKRDDELDVCWKKGVLQFGVEVVHAWLQVMDKLVDSEHSSAWFRRLNMEGSLIKVLLRDGRRWIADMPITELEALAVNGHDLIKMSGKRGAWIGQVLEQLLEAVALRHVENERSALMRYVKNEMKELIPHDE